MASKKRRHTIDIMDNFTKVQNGSDLFRKCVICSRSFSMNSGYNTPGRDAKTNSFMLNEKLQIFNPSGSIGDHDYAPRKERNEAFIRPPFLWAVCSAKSFSVAEGAEFRKMLQILDNDPNLPIRTTIQRIIWQTKRTKISRKRTAFNQYLVQLPCLMTPGLQDYTRDTCESHCTLLKAFRKSEILF